LKYNTPLLCPEKKNHQILKTKSVVSFITSSSFSFSCLSCKKKNDHEIFFCIFSYHPHCAKFSFAMSANAK
jgi:hypothetical protein